MEAEVAHIPNKWLLKVFCKVHQYQIMTRGNLVDINLFLVVAFNLAVDEPGYFKNYFGVVQRLFYTWRDLARDIFEDFASPLGPGPQVAMEVCAKVPPKPLIGRFNQATVC